MLSNLTGERITSFQRSKAQHPNHLEVCRDDTQAASRIYKFLLLSFHIKAFEFMSSGNLGRTIFA
jgi:hypothetical protein